MLSGLADACLFAPRIKSNYAEDDAAIYYTSGTDNSGSGIYFNDGSPTRLGLDCGPDSVADLGRTRDCNAGDDTCNAVIANATQHSDTSPSAGATVFNANGDTIAHADPHTRRHRGARAAGRVGRNDEHLSLPGYRPTWHRIICSTFRP